jgi:photoactive yellow protein
MVSKKRKPVPPGDPTSPDAPAGGEAAGGVVCAWCGRTLAAAPAATGTSHGLCAACARSLDVFPLEDLSEAPDAVLDALPFGVIRLDRGGHVIAYNRSESRLSGMRPARVMGRNFFTEVAPCTMVAAFRGRFERMMRSREPSRLAFTFLFTLRDGDRMVAIDLACSPARGIAQIVVKELGRVADGEAGGAPPAA